MIAKNEVEKLAQRVENLEIGYEQLDLDDLLDENARNNIEEQLEAEVYEIEEYLQRELGIDYKDIYYGNTDLGDKQVVMLVKRIKQLKDEKGFFDSEAELDRMFPDRHDDDFDEESMSYDSVFGDD